MNFLRLVTFGCVWVVLCSAVTAPCFAQERINLFDRKNKNSEKRIKRTVEGDLQRQIIQALQDTGNPEKQNNSRTFLYYGTFFVGLAAVVAGLVYWQFRRRKWIEWALNDPLALVQELNVAHQLSEQEKQMMQELSERHSLPSTLKLFVEPKFLLEARDDEFFVSSRPVVQLLLSKLFNVTAGDRKTTLVLSPAEAEVETEILVSSAH